MQFFQDFTQIQLTEPTILTIGTFDGLHLGHQALIKQLQVSAKKGHALTAVMAFHPRPKAIMAPHLPNNDYLTTPEERIKLFEQFGLDVLLMIPFTRQLAETSAADFMKQIKQRLNLVELWTGYDFALGKNREGNLPRLTDLGRELGYTVHEAKPCFVHGQIVSSTQIRYLFQQGEVHHATKLLGRYPSLSGEIVVGAQRGRTIGFPTANFSFSRERLLPANGVYATFIKRVSTGQSYPSVTNIGLRPSFVTAGTERTIETHIFDFSDTVYGEIFNLEFVARLRAEKKFNSPAELISQIYQDIAQAREELRIRNCGRVARNS